MDQRTIQARRSFRKMYGTETFAVVSRIIQGKDSRRIETEVNVPYMSVAAYRANVTRGTYLPWVDGSNGNYYGAIVPQKD